MGRRDERAWREARSVADPAGTYGFALAEAEAVGTAWPCPCGTLNPPGYDACHECQRPSWDCYCGAVNSCAHSRCRRCGEVCSARFVDRLAR